MPEQRTLLIVDDEEGPRQSLRVVFKDYYNLLMASDGDQATELGPSKPGRRGDHGYPHGGHMSGVELLEQLKAVDPAIEVIMLTAY